MDRDTVDTARNGMERFKAKSQMKALVRKSSRVMWTSPRQRTKSVLQFESDRVFDEQRVSVPECWLQAQQCLGVVACESTVAAW